ncbi:Vsp/OspC family lipoprotein (plasmid) [Borrelia puertoricensis]|uniref:Vsp/OspC family lipoprotein n=1 Tax=Borrelia puertoricensis TaxID=2756107 RepID=UPI003EBD7DEA
MKRITLCALLMTLFLLISCNTSGKDLKEDEVAKSDGTVIDLVKITKHITDTVAFAKSVKEVHSLVKSIDELAKAIGKKIHNDGTLTDDGSTDKNTSLMSGVYSIVLDIDKKSKALSVLDSFKEQILDEKVISFTTATKAFLDKLKSKHAELGVDQGAATKDNAQKAIDRTSQPNGDKGAEELGKLNTAIDALLTAAEAAVTSAINELTTSTKP